jgi:glutathione synthase/RimK-type ligase-like ATP-grasp enzyme
MSTRRCAFLTHDRTRTGTADDRVAMAALTAGGWRVDAVPWDEAVPWASYDVAVIRSTWDYHRRLGAYLGRLGEIAAAGCRVLNPLPLVRWNADKTYLRELAGLGVATVPASWRTGAPPGCLTTLFDELGADEMVVKPAVSASAEGTALVRRGTSPDPLRAVEAALGDRPFVAQPVATAVRTEGEYSLIYFGGAYSHAVLKTPAPGDFRVQEEHGGTACRVEPDQAQRAAASRALGLVRPVPLYARVDIVRANDGEGWWLMELELIEPALYFGVEREAAGRFAEALEARMGGAEPDISVGNVAAVE